VDSNQLPSPKFATADEIQGAFEALSTEELYKLELAARACLPGTEFRDPKELRNEVLVRAISGTRHWPHGEVDFVTFMIMTMSSIADGSRQSPAQRRTRSIDPTQLASVGSREDSAAEAWATPSAEAVQVERDEDGERQSRAAADAQLIDKHFESDEGVQYLLMGLKDGQSASEIRDLMGWSSNEYATVRRRLRRGLTRLFPGRSQR
jgi:hypothetical protein